MKKEEQNRSLPENDVLPEDYTINLSDFALFLSVMKNKEAYECTLSIILDEEDLELTDVKVEQVILNRIGKRPYGWMHGHWTRRTARSVRKCRMT